MPSFRFPSLVLSPLLALAVVPSSAAKPAKHAKQTRPTKPAKPKPAVEHKRPAQKMEPTRHEAKASIVDHKPMARPSDGKEPPLLEAAGKQRPLKAPPKKTLAQLLAEAGSPLTKIAFSTTRLSVRRPWADDDTFLSFQGKVSVQPGRDRDGFARITGATVPKNADVPIDQTPGPSVNGMPVVDLGPQGKLVVTFTAGGGENYVVSCGYASEEGDPMFGASVRDGGQQLSGGLTRRNRRVMQVVPARVKRRVVEIELTAQYTWTTSGCTVSSGR